MSPHQGRGGIPADDPMQQTRLMRRVGAEATPAGLDVAGQPPARRRRGRRVLLVGAVIAALLAGYVAVLATIAWSGLDRTDAAPDGSRPPAGPGTTWLLVGSDSRADLTPQQQQELSTGGGDSRLADTILLLTTAPGGVPTLISIPRDSLVSIPGYGENKINAAYAFGGPELLVDTIEQATGVRLDGYVEIGFDGFSQVVETLGGVQVCLEAPMSDERAGIDLPAGCQTLAGADTLGFVRARYSDPNGDLGRVERQRQVIAAMADEVTRPAVLANPARTIPLAATGGQALTVDDQAGPVDLTRFAITLLRATGEGGEMLTVPFGGFATTAAGSVVLWDSAAETLWAALRDGTPLPEALLQ